jgi:hypothetical protein
MLALDERDKLLIEAARRFCIGMSDRAAAHYLRGRLIRYRECRWRRTCTELRCPHDAGRLDGMCWHLLKVRDHVPPERLIRLVLSGRKRQSFSEPPP